MLQKFIERAKSKDGVWFMSRNLNAEIFKPWPDELTKQAMKMFIKEKEVHLYGIFGKVPNLAIYSLGDVHFEATEDGIQINTLEHPKKRIDMTQDKDGGKENLNGYLEEFFKIAEMTKEEYERYGERKETANLPVIKVSRTCPL